MSEFSLDAPLNLSFEESIVRGDPVQLVETQVETKPVTNPEPGPTPPRTGYREQRLIEEFEEENIPAALRVILSDGTRVIPDYTSFFLQSANEQDAEKLQITETKGKYWAHLYGRKPRIWAYSGTLISSRNHDWLTLFDALYERYLRATKCVELGAQVQLTYSGKAVYGLMIMASKGISSDNPKAVPFSFQLLIDDVELLRQSDVLNDRYGVASIDGVAALGDLQSLDSVARRVSELDFNAGEVVDAILRGELPPGSVATEYGDLLSTEFDVDTQIGISPPEDFGDLLSTTL